MGGFTALFHQFDRHIPQARKTAQDMFDPVYFNAPPSEFHLSIRATEELERAIRAHSPQIAGEVERPVVPLAGIGDEGCRALLRTVVIAQREAEAADGDLPGRAVRHFAQLIVQQNRGFACHGPAYRHRAATRILQRDLMCKAAHAGLGRAVCVDQPQVRPGAHQLFRHRGRHHVAARQAEPDAGKCVDPVVDDQMVQPRVPGRHSDLMTDHGFCNVLHAGGRSLNHRDGGAGHQRDQDLIERAVTGNRRRSERDIARSHRDLGLGQCHGGDRAVRDDHALGLSGGAGSIEDAGRAFATDLGPIRKAGRDRAVLGDEDRDGG